MIERDRAEAIALPDHMAAKLSTILAGGSAILDDHELDAIAAYVEEKGGPDADRWFRDLQVSRNAEQVGVRDGYVAQLRDPSREAYIILNASVKAPPRWSWRPVGAKRSKATGFGSPEEAVAALTAAGYKHVPRPA